MSAAVTLTCPASLIGSDAVIDLQDYETFHEALEEDSSYASSLAKSLSLVLDEFYQNLRTVSLHPQTLWQPATKLTCDVLG